MLYLASDHRGYAAQKKIELWLQNNALTYVNVGSEKLEPEDDYVDRAVAVCTSIKQKEDRGILLCGTGQGVCITANRYPNIRAVLAFNSDIAKYGRIHENANVLCLPADWLSFEEITASMQAFLETEYSAVPRYDRRLQKLEKVLSSS